MEYKIYRIEKNGMEEISVKDFLLEANVGACPDTEMERIKQELRVLKEGINYRIDNFLRNELGGELEESLCLPHYKLGITSFVRSLILSKKTFKKEDIIKETHLKFGDLTKMDSIRSSVYNVMKEMKDRGLIGQIEPYVFGVAGEVIQAQDKIIDDLKQEFLDTKCCTVRQLLDYAIPRYGLGSIEAKKELIADMIVAAERNKAKIRGQEGTRDHKLLDVWITPPL